MDFGELLHTAKKNEQARPQIRYYSTKFAAPKKEHRAKNISINVQKFLAKKEAEEQQKRMEAQERKQKLLELRSHDKKATRRVNVMLKRTKSASQAVIADALDTDNTAVTLVGPSQPDEDDYGYVSQESSALYIKMMEKYSKMPEEPKFPEMKKKISTNLSSTKDRVKAALEREKEEALLPHRRKRKHKDSGGENEKDVVVEEEVVEPEKKEPTTKLKFKAAPVVNFSDLLKLAEKKQFEPVVIETKKDEDERPLTKKQKKEMEREREWKERKESRSKGLPEKAIPTFNRIPKLNGTVTQTGEKIIKKVPVESQELKTVQKGKEVPSDQHNHKALDRNANVAKMSKTSSKLHKLNTEIDRKTSLDKFELNRKVDSQQRSQNLNSVKNSAVKFSDKSKQRDSPTFQKPKPPSISNDHPSKAIPSRPLQKKSPPSDDRPKHSPQQNGIKTKQIPLNSLKPKQFPPNDLKPKQFTAIDPKPKQFNPPDIRKNYPPKDVKRKAMLNKRRIVDDEDYDSEMDDFIDDGPEDQQDYSKYISEIFGYDKRKYNLDDEDVDNMESTFAQQMKEEVISTRIGILEDLEDMRQEEEAKKKKQLMLKKCKKS